MDYVNIQGEKLLLNEIFLLFPEEILCYRSAYHISNLYLSIDCHLLLTFVSLQISIAKNLLSLIK